MFITFPVTIRNEKETDETGFHPLAAIFEYEQND